MMNQHEIELLEKEVESHDVYDPKTELAWIENQLVDLRAEKQKQVYLFRMLRFMRDDSRLSTAAADVKKLASAIDYLEARKGNLR